MDWVIWIGAALSLTGVGLLIWCVVQAVTARRAGLEQAAMRARLQRLVAINLAAIGISTIGLMAVILGIALG